ncbi:MAG: ferritin family protein [Nitrospirota bacterium]|nr:ferritin family protein [Nitrospirota bacterium]
MALFHGDEDILQILTVSFLLENGMQQFYEKASVKASYPSAAKTFETLSKVEDKHMLNIFNLYSGLTEEKALTIDEFKARMKSDIMEGGGTVLQGLAKAENVDFTNIKEVLDFALEREQESFDFYSANAKAASESGAKVLFNELAESEAHHIAIIKKELTAMTSSVYR